MDLKISKWGKSLALRFHSCLARQPTLRERAPVEAKLMADGTLSIQRVQWNRRAFASELAEARSSMPLGTPVMNEVRSGSRY